MLNLDSSRWLELEHAYGVAGDIPALLQQLQNLPDAVGDSEPWFSLWSALAHQGDVYTASYAAVPHVVAAFARSPETAPATYFQFPAWVEICRHKNGPPIPQDLQLAYLAALARLPQLIAHAAAREWSPDELACALSALAAAKGQTSVAEAVLELTPDVAGEFMEWFYSR
jgi:hypothetical protein